MKRKLLLAFAISAVLMLVFAISIFAAEIPEWTETIRYETGDNAIAYKEGFDTTSRVMLSNGDGTYSTYPSNYIIKGTDAKFSSNETDFSALKTATGKSYTNASIVRLEVPSGFTSVEGSAFRTGSGLKVTSMLTIKLPEGITSFGSYVFYSNAVIAEVELPSTLATIEGTEPFYKTTSLKKIVIPASLTSIPSKAFNSCSALEEVDFSNCTSLVSIGDRAFQYCDALKSVVLPEGLQTINECAFFDSDAIEYVYIPSSVTTVGDKLFQDSASIKTVVCKAQVIGAYAFSNCSTITSLTLENTRIIGDRAFYGLSALETDVIIPEGCTEIGEYAFKTCGTTKVTLPSTLTTVEIGVFTDSTNITVVDSKAPTIGASMFYNCSSISSLTLENTVTIGTEAFYVKGTMPVTSLSLPDTLVSIGKYAFIRSSITRIVVPASVTTYELGAFYECKSLQEAVVLGGTMGSNMFYGCSSLQTLVITDKLTSIGTAALSGVSDTSFTIFYTGTDYENIKTIGSASGSGYTRFKDAKYSSYESYKAGAHTQSKYIFIYDANLCELVYGGEHAASTTEYKFTSFMEPSSVEAGCQRCGKTTTVEEVKPLFIFLGYSVEESTMGSGMSVGYRIDQEAIDAYERITEEKIAYGIFVAVAEKLGNNDIVNEETKQANQGALIAEVSNEKFLFLKLKLVNIADSQKDERIAIGAYVIAKNKVNYLQSGAPANGEKYYFTSYNEQLG